MALITTILIVRSLSFAQYTTYNPALSYQSNTLGYPYYQYTTYPAYQTSSYWSNATGSYIDPYSQTYAYNVGQGGYTTSLLNPNTPYNTISPYAYSSLNQGSLLYNYNPLGYAYSPLLYSALSPLGLPLNLAGTYNSQISSTNTIADGTTNSNGTSVINGSNYTAQAASYYPAIYPGITNSLQINPYALSTISLSSAYANPFSNYLPIQSYYQNPYVSYPYNYGQSNIINPYQYQSPYVYTTNPYASNTVNPYTQQTTYTQPLPYYQTNSTTTNTNASTQGTLANVNGTWAGTWFTTLANGTVDNGDTTLSLIQNSTGLSGSISFSLNSYQKLSTNVNGTINGSNLTLTGSLISGTEFYTLYVNGSLSGSDISGTYSISTNNGTVVESGTYTIARL